MAANSLSSSSSSSSFPVARVNLSQPYHYLVLLHETLSLSPYRDCFAASFTFYTNGGGGATTVLLSNNETIRQLCFRRENRS